MQICASLAALVYLFPLACQAGAGLEKDPLFNDRTVAVFMTGLPGDAESENAYEDQLERLLEINALRSAAKCLILCDRPGAFSERTNSRLMAIKGDREHFLALPAMIGNGSNPVTIVVWGHGGIQGEKPVFHVSGPRITAEDLCATAAKLPADSMWILMFRGSGAFARGLAASDRQVLSSEKSITFESDPNGMPLLIEVVKKHPRASLAEISAQFGPLVAEWYSQRNLARTEEPTLWLDKDSPQSLEEPPRPTDSEWQKNVLANSSAPPAQSMEPGLDTPSDWKQVRLVSAANYPHSAAVVLSSRQACYLGTDPAVVSEREEFIQILKPEGKKVGDFDVAYSPPDEELDFEVCEVRRPDGKIVEMDSGVVGEAGKLKADYGVVRRKVFSLPGVGPGSVVHVKYRSQWKNYPMPRVCMDFPVGGEFPTLTADLEVRLPKKWPLHFVCEGKQEPQPTTSERAYAASYHWHWTNVAAEFREPLSPPRRRRSLSISTFNNWAEFAQWYSQITRLTDESAPEIIAKANELTRTAKSPEERIRAIYDYVTSLRYVAVPLGISAVRPHAAADVLRNQFGDCKDKANLLNSLLHALNIKADLVLVPRFRQADEALPGFAFNHAISRVVMGSEMLWLDSTDEACRFGLLPPGDSGRNVLVIEPNATALTRLPEPTAEKHRLRLNGTIFCGPGGVAAAKFAATGMGCVDYQLRNSAHENDPSLEADPLLARRYSPVAGSLAISNQTTLAVSDKDHDYTWNAEGAVVGLVSVTGDRHILHSPAWLPREWDLALNHRQTPLFLNDGYPLVLDEQFEVIPCSEDRLDVLPPRAASDTRPLRWEVSWTRSANGNVVARLLATLATGTLTMKESQDFQVQLQALRQALSADAGFNSGSPLTQR